MSAVEFFQGLMRETHGIVTKTKHIDCGLKYRIYIMVNTLPPGPQLQSFQRMSSSPSSNIDKEGKALGFEYAGDPEGENNENYFPIKDYYISLSNENY